MHRPATLVPLLAAVAVGLPVLVLGSLLAGPVVGVVAAVLLGVVAAAIVVAGADGVALGQLAGARAVSADDEPRLHNVVDGMCLAAGVSKPELRVLDDPAANAVLLGRRQPTLVVTRALLDRLELIELEGVVAQQLAHLKSGKVRADTLTVPLALVAPGLAGRIVEPHREATADAGAVTLTRYPPGLLAALEKVVAGPFAVRSGWRTTRHLWLARASDELNERIDTLREL
jgi:heat shock protein HtpX